ncbi:vinculin [Biomphalaria glabrata]|uniref:Vinculin n=1 Tax=Biomphalaria glabrata TaxID=6526 RepID=A0A2C9LUV3_BIOGL
MCDRDAILRSASDVESMVNALSELRQQGKGSSPQAMALARGIQEKLKELQQQTAIGIMNTERSGIRKPAPTVEGKVEQAKQWLVNPGLDDKGLGEAATRLIVNEGRKVANCCTGPQRQELLRLCDEVEILTNQLSDMCKRGQGNGPQAKAIARNLSEKLASLKTKIQDALVNQVAEDFIDTTTPLKQLSEAASVPLGKSYHFKYILITKTYTGMIASQVTFMSIGLHLTSRSKKYAMFVRHCSKNYKFYIFGCSFRIKVDHILAEISHRMVLGLGF